MKKGATALPRSGRRYVSLRGRNDFAAAYRGRRRSAGAVVVLVSEGPEGPPLVAIVAGKKVGNAVRRNRAKRRLRAAIGRVHLRDGTAYIVIARSGVVDAPFDRLVAWLTVTTQSKAEPEEVRAPRDVPERETR